MAKKRKSAKEACVQFNEVRETYAGETFTREELITLLAGVLPRIHREYSLLPKLGIVEKTGRRYKFPNEPVFIGKIETYLEKIRPNKKSENSPSNEEEPKLLFEEDVIEKAIETLKSTGDYRILKKVITINWEEV